MTHAELDRLVGRTIAQLAADAGREPVRGVRRRAAPRRLATGSCSTSGTRRTCRRSCATRGTPAERRPAGRRQAAPPRLGHLPALSRPLRRDLGVFTLEECVGHLTGRAAARLRLRDRGLVKAGHAADLVLFDPATVADTATFADPRQPAAGIPYVFVNGELAMDDGSRTDALAGRALRRLPDGAVA